MKQAHSFLCESIETCSLEELLADDNDDNNDNTQFMIA